MNKFTNYLFQKEKLIHVAIPTEDGPFCEKSNSKALPTQNENIAKTFSAALSDIEENDRYSKGNLTVNPSMIYADFLTNGDAWEKQSLNETIWNNMVITPKENKPAKKNVTIEWLNTDEEQIKRGDIQQPQITSTDLVESSSITKISEFENPLLVHMSVIQNKDTDKNKGIKYENRRKSRIKNANKEDSLLAEMPTNVVINHEQNFMLSDQNTNTLLPTQKNTIVDINNYIEADNNITLQKKYNIDLPMDPAAQSLDDKSKIEQTVPHTTHTLPLVKSMNDYCAIIENPKEYSAQLNADSKESSNNAINNNETEKLWEVNLIPHTPNDSNVTKKPKIKILSEKTISDPILVTGHLEPVSLNSVYVHIPKKKSITSISSTEIKSETKDTEIKEFNINEKKSNENILTLVDESKKAHGLSNTIELNVDKANEVVPKPPIIKHKIAPERVAAIEKKRNFNKRLRDIIEICLDKLDDQDKSNGDNKAADISKIANKESEKLKGKEKSMKQNNTYLSKQTELPNTQEYNIMNFLETRMKKMEDALMGKIEQNSQKIVELNKTINQSSKVTTTNKPKNQKRKMKTASTQTFNDKETYKRHLYEEISSYLSPNANSLIYEELFINQYAPKLSNQASSPKKRKRR